MLKHVKLNKSNVRYSALQVARLCLMLDTESSNSILRMLNSKCLDESYGYGLISASNMIRLAVRLLTGIKLDTCLCSAQKWSLNRCVCSSTIDVSNAF